MNSLRCAYYQWRISAALDRDDGGGRLPRRHMDRCPACRAFHERSVALAAALRRDAAGATAPARGATVVRDCEHDRAAGRGAWRPWAWAAGLAAAACVVAAVLVLSQGGRREAPQVAREPTSPDTAPAVALASREEAAKMLAVASDPLSALRDVARRPIQKGIEDVRAEAQAAGRFLASQLPFDVGLGGSD
jgi:hypothetical protein